MKPRYVKAKKKIWKTQKTGKLGLVEGVLELPIPVEPGKPDSPNKGIRNLIPQDPDNPVKGIQYLVQNGTQIQWP